MVPCIQLRSARKNDILICWFDFQGVLCWWLSKLTFRKRNIVIVNIMLKDKTTLRNRVVSWLYKKVLTAGSELYGGDAVLIARTLSAYNSSQRGLYN